MLAAATSPAQALLDSLFAQYREYIWTEYATVSAAALLWWEYILTFEDEREYFWNSKRSWIQILFFLNRYLVLFESTVFAVGMLLPKPTYQFCVSYIIFGTVGSFLAIVIIDLILTWQLYAVFGQSKKILAFLSILLLLTTAAEATILGIQSAQTHGTNEPFPGFFICFGTTKLNILYTFWIPVVIFEGIAFILNAVGLWKHVRKMRDIDSNISIGESLLRCIFRGSAMYFVVIFAVGIANSFLYKFGNPAVYNLLHGISTAVMSISVSRMLINIREEHKALTKLEIGAASGTEMSQIHFTNRAFR